MLLHPCTHCHCYHGCYCHRYHCCQCHCHCHCCRHCHCHCHCPCHCHWHLYYSCVQYILMSTDSECCCMHLLVHLKYFVLCTGKASEQCQCFKHHLIAPPPSLPHPFPHHPFPALGPAPNITVSSKKPNLQSSKELQECQPDGERSMLPIHVYQGAANLPQHSKGCRSPIYITPALHAALSA